MPTHSIPSFRVRVLYLSLASIDNGRRVLVFDGPGVAAASFDGSDDPHRFSVTIRDLAKHDVLRVEPASEDRGNEELGAVGVRPGVGHGQKERLVVLQLEVLIGELLAVNGLSAGAIATGEVSALEHEIGDHTVELGSLVAEALLTGAQGTEILSRLGNDIIEELEIDATGLVLHAAGFSHLALAVDLDLGAGPGNVEESRRTGRRFAVREGLARSDGRRRGLAARETGMDEGRLYAIIMEML